MVATSIAIRVVIAAIAAHVASACIWMGPIGKLWAETKFAMSLAKIQAKFAQEGAHSPLPYLGAFVSFLLLAYAFDQHVLQNEYIHVTTVKQAVLFAAKLTSLLSIVQVQNYAMNNMSYLVMAIDFFSQFVVISVVSSVLVLLA